MWYVYQAREILCFCQKRDWKMLLVPCGCHDELLGWKTLQGAFLKTRFSSWRSPIRVWGWFILDLTCRCFTGLNINKRYRVYSVCYCFQHPVLQLFIIRKSGLWVPTGIMSRWSHKLSLSTHIEQHQHVVFLHVQILSLHLCGLVKKRASREATVPTY